LQLLPWHAEQGLKANSTEIDPKTPYPVVSTMAEQVGKENTGGTMRLGDYTAVLERGTKARKLIRPGKNC
jgi:CTP synthase